MSYATIRAELKTVLESVTDVAVVHDYLRWTNDRSRLLQLYKNNGRINAWEFTRTRNEREQLETGNRFRSTHFMLIKGYFSLKDDAASELTFQDLVEAVADKLQQDANLNGKATLMLPPNSDISHEFKSNVLVHFVEMTLEIFEDVNF